MGDNFFSPTVLGDATADMLIFREETFGPVDITPNQTLPHLRTHSCIPSRPPCALHVRP